MNEKHLIWIVPMLLIVGFVLGYVSGLNIPKEITFGISDKTESALNQTLNTMHEISENKTIVCQPVICSCLNGVGLRR